MKHMKMKVFIILILSLIIHLNSLEPPPIRPSLVVSYHKLAQKAGYEILNAGGNAFDAYVAVTLVENVLSCGEVTLAGLMGTLMYQAKTDTIMYLDAGFNSVLDPQATPDPRDPVPGKLIMVPGVLAGLEAISEKFGRLPFSQLLRPAIKIAANGYPISRLHADRIEEGADKLKKTEYGRHTFFPKGTALKPGDILKQPELAEFLTKTALQGAAHMYRGNWAKYCVETVRKSGGLMTQEDLAHYRPDWSEPWKIQYRGLDIFASSGRTMMGLWVLTAMKILEHTEIANMGPNTASADVLEILVRISREMIKEKWIRDFRSLENHGLVNSRLTSKYALTIWNRIRESLPQARQTQEKSPSTMTSIVADREGNVVSGKHSINSELWGSGMFVQGILLNSSGDMYGRFTGPGKRRLHGASNFLVFDKGRLKYVCGTYSSSNPYAALQFLVNLIDFRISPDRVVELPRFGSFPYDETDWTVDWTRNWLDNRVSPAVVETLKKRGLNFSQQSPKLGKGCLAEFFSDGKTVSGYDRSD